MSGAGERVLLADIGGTNARFALADTRAAMPLLAESVREFPVADFRSLDAVARHYLKVIAPTALDDSGIRRGVFAVAGRIQDDEAHITNHPWIISRRDTQAALRFDSLQLINDFTAQARAIPLLESDALVQIGGARLKPAPPGTDRTYAVLGPGTGLGVSALIVRDGRSYPLETEGGHISFAPLTNEEAQILGYLAGDFGRVSNERLISGPGLVNIYQALSRIAGDNPGPLRPADITEGAARGEERCLRTVDIFCAVFGAIAGDLVLTLGAWDGVYLTGGLVPKMLHALQHSGFRQRFEHKGRFLSTMAAVPTLAVVHPQPGLLGAAALAVQHGVAPPRND